MRETRKVLLFGKSLQMAGLQATLSAVMDLNVHQVAVGEDELMDCVRLGNPDVIVFELGTLSAQAALNLLTQFPNIELIGVDGETNRLLLLSVRQHSEPDTEDLVRMIQRKGVAA